MVYPNFYNWPHICKNLQRDAEQFLLYPVCTDTRNEGMLGPNC